MNPSLEESRLALDAVVNFLEQSKASTHEEVTESLTTILSAVAIAFVAHVGDEKATTIFQRLTGLAGAESPSAF